MTPNGTTAYQVVEGENQNVQQRVWKKTRRTDRELIRGQIKHRTQLASAAHDDGREYVLDSERNEWAVDGGGREGIGVVVVVVEREGKRMEGEEARRTAKPASRSPQIQSGGATRGRPVSPLQSAVSSVSPAFPFIFSSSFPKYLALFFKDGLFPAEAFLCSQG